MTQYVQIYLTENQADALRRHLYANTLGLADSNVLKVVHRRVAEAQAVAAEKRARVERVYAAAETEPSDG